MDEDEDEYSQMKNFESLKTHLKIDCSKFLGNVLQMKYQDVESLKQSETFQKLDHKSKQEIVKKNSFVLSIPVLCDVLIKRNSEIEEGGERFHNDVIRLRDIWESRINSNDDEMIPSESLQHITRELKEIGDRMVERFDDIGNSYVASIQKLQQDEIVLRDLETSAQIGNRNTMSIAFEPQQTESLFFMEQVGDKNKMIIQLEDRRQAEQLELRSSGEVQLRMVLRSNQTAEWRQITENVLKLNIKDLNSRHVLRDNDIVVDSIEKGCLVVSFNTASGLPIQECLKILFEVLFEVLDIESTLRKFNVSEIRINGYVYCPEQFKEGPNSQTCQELFIVRHVSWTTTTTKCDIDVYVSKLMKTLMHGDFSTDVDERIDVQMKWDFGPSSELHQVSVREDMDKLLTKEMNILPFEINSLTTTGNPILLSLKCTGKIAYSQFFVNDGLLIKITKTLFSNVSDTTLRLSVFVDTTFVNQIPYLTLISNAVRSNSFPHIITAMLEGKDHSLLKNIEELKLKAILEVREDKEEHEQVRIKRRQVKFKTAAPTTEKQESVTNLLEASRTGNPNLVHRLLEEGIDPNIRNKNLKTALHIAIEGNHQRVADELIYFGAEINVIDENQETPLLTASRCGHWKIVRSLLQQGADPEVVDLNNQTSLFIAAKNGYRNALIQLLKFGANVNSCNKGHLTPLHVACMNGNYKVVKELLAYGADVHYIDKDKNTPLHSTLLKMNENSFDIQIIEELLCKGTLVNKKNGNFKTPLYITVEKGLVNASRKLLQAEADVNLTDSKNNLPLHIACRNCHVETVQELLKITDAVDRCNAEGLTARMLAKDVKEFTQMFDALDLKHEYIGNTAFKFAKQGKINEILPFLDQKKYLEARDSHARSLLFIASWNGHIDIVRLLIKSNVDVNECDSTNRSPLSVAAEHKYYSIVELLLQSGADANIVDNFERTALHYAVKSGSADIASIIIQHGPLAYKADIEGRTPLHFCGIFGNVDVANVLLGTKEDIDLNECDINCLTALHETIKSGQLDVAEFLLRHSAKPSSCDKRGRAPLHIAAEMGSINAIDILLRFKGEINQCDECLQTPVYLAAKHGRSAIFELIKHGSDTNICDVRGRTPLHASLENKSVFATKILVEHSSDVNFADKKGTTPLHLASSLGNSEAVDILLEAKADPNASDTNGCTSLHYCTSGAVLRLLIQNGGCVNCRNMYGKTPLHAAVEFLCLEDNDFNKRCENLIIMNELLQNDADICVSDNDMETVVHKSVKASNYHVLIELLSSKLCPEVQHTLTGIVDDCLRKSKNERITDTLSHWITIHVPKEVLATASNVNILENELCPSDLYKEHEEWLRKHKLTKRANILQRVMSLEKALKEGRKRKESSCGELSLIEPMEKMLRMEGESRNAAEK